MTAKLHLTCKVAKDLTGRMYLPAKAVTFLHASSALKKNWEKNLVACKLKPPSGMIMTGYTLRTAQYRHQPLPCK